MQVKQPHPDALAYIKANYFCIDGEIFNPHGKKVGFVPTGKNRVFIQVGCRNYKRAHIVWYLCTGYWPTLQISHKSKDFLDDRIENLEECTATERMSKRENSKMYRGCSVRLEQNGRWRAKNYKYSQDLGYYATEEAAKAAVDDFKAKGKQWWVT